MIDPLDLHAYIDGELPSEQATPIRLRIEESAEAAKEAEAIRSLKKLLADKKESPPCEAAWSKCVARLDEIDRTKQSAKVKWIESIVARFAPGFCLLLFVGILVAPRMIHRNPSDLTDKDFAKMVGGLSDPASPKAPGTNRERWEEWILRQSFASTPDHLTIRGAKSGWLDGVPVTQFIARDPYGDLEMFRIDEPLILKGTVEMEGHPDFMVGNLNGVNCLVRNDGPITILIVAQRPYEALAKIASQVTPR